MMVRGLEAPQSSSTRPTTRTVGRRAFPEWGRCCCVVLLSNHAHLVLQTDAGALSRVMRRLNGGYASPASTGCEDVAATCSWIASDRASSKATPT
jgi:hypothetical protein